ncbi:MAG: hypothetical protein EBT09_14555 [Actinobacteria bacterium]|nr:hypothetical protein [Actinomycetota bacterium]
MPKINNKESLTKSKEEIAFLENQQIEIYEKLCKSLKTKDNEGFVWDFLFNGSDDVDDVILHMNDVK